MFDYLLSHLELSDIFHYKIMLAIITILAISLYLYLII